jgi:protoheme IX farnesyltransferase
VTSLDVPDRVAADKVDIGGRAARVDLGVKAIRGNRQLARVRDVATAYLGLTKPRIIELLLVTTVPAMFLAAGGVPPLTVVLFTMVGGCLAAASANAFNCVLDRDIDEQMRRTRRRPLPRHAVGPLGATVFGAILGIAATLWLGYFVNWLSAALALGANAFYIAVYTLWLKRRTPQNIIWGGIAGCFPPLIGWTAVTGSLALLRLSCSDRFLTAAHLGALFAIGRITRGERAYAACRGRPCVARLIMVYLLVMVCVSCGAHRTVSGRRPRRCAALAIRTAAGARTAWSDRRRVAANATLSLVEFLSRTAFCRRGGGYAAPLKQCSLTKRVDHETSQRRHRGNDA